MKYSQERKPSAFGEFSRAAELRPKQAVLARLAPTHQRTVKDVAADDISKTNMASILEQNGIKIMYEACNSLDVDRSIMNKINELGFAASDLVDERLFFTYTVINTAATPLHNAQPWRLFYARILELRRA